MHNVNSYLILSLVTFWLPCFCTDARQETRIGVILDETSRPGKEAKVAIELAIQDFKIKTNQHFVLYLQNSRSKPIYAATAAKELIDKHNVVAILGGHTWEEASAIAEVIREADHDIDIPLFVSFTATPPLQTTDQWPFFVQSVPSQSIQMNAIAAILYSWNIRNVSLIHETSHLATSSASIISHLSRALLETGSELTHILPLKSGSYSLDLELEELKRQQRKVFVIHTSLKLAVQLFQTANKMGMTGYGYVWIATNEITDHLPSINPTMSYSLKGMLGVKSSIPENMPNFQHFRKKFRQKFNSDYPDEEQEEPGIFAVQGYNTVINLLGKNFQKWTPDQKKTVEIVYVIGKGYHSVYWTEGSGFSETIENEINEATTTYFDSIDSLQDVLFPVGQWYANKYSREGFGSLQTHRKIFMRLAATILHSLLLLFRFISHCLGQGFGFIRYLAGTILYGLFPLFCFIFKGLVQVFGFVWYLAETIIYGLFRVFPNIFDGLVQVSGFIGHRFPLLFHFIFDGLVQVSGFIWYLTKTVGYGFSLLFHLIFDDLGQVSGVIGYVFSLLFHFIFDGLVQVSGFIWHLTKIIGYGFSLLFEFILDPQVLGFIWNLGETIVFRLTQLIHFIFDSLAQMSSYIVYLVIAVLVWFIAN